MGGGERGEGVLDVIGSVFVFFVLFCCFACVVTRRKTWNKFSLARHVLYRKICLLTFFVFCFFGYYLYVFLPSYLFSLTGQERLRHFEAV